jgi:ParB family transcriptional regulator, chromosome partitioning protein
VTGLAESSAANALLRSKEVWDDRLPGKSNALWDFLLQLDGDSRADLFALCAGQSINAMYLPNERRPDALAHADRLAEQIGLDMTEHWTPTADNFFGRVTKSRILAAVREAKGEPSAQLIEHLKKGEMAKEAERLIQGTGWLPQPLRTPGWDDGTMRVVMMAATAPIKTDEPDEPTAAEAEALPAFLAGEGDTGEDRETSANETVPGSALKVFERDLERDAEENLDRGYYGIAAE